MLCGDVLPLVGQGCVTNGRLAASLRLHSSQQRSDITDTVASARPYHPILALGPLTLSLPPDSLTPIP